MGTKRRSTSLVAEFYGLEDVRLVVAELPRRLLFRGQRFDHLIISSRLYKDSNLVHLLTALGFLASKRVRILNDNGTTVRILSFRDFLRTAFMLLVSLAQVPLYALLGTAALAVISGRGKGSRRLPLNGEVTSVTLLRSHVGSRPDIGGALAHWKGVVDGLRQNGVTVQQVVATNQSGVVAADEEVEVKTSLQAFPPHEFFRFVQGIQFYVLAILTHLIDRKRRVTGSMIYHRYSLMDVSGLLLAKSLRIPLVLEYNGSEVWIEENWGTGLTFGRCANWVENLILKNADLVVCISDPLREELLLTKDVKPESILVVPNGVDLTRFDVSHPPTAKPHEQLPAKQRENGNVTYGFVGSFGHWHGVLLILRAFAAVVKVEQDNHLSSSSSQLILAGSGPLLEEAKQLAIELEIDEVCHFLGPVPPSEIPGILGKCDVLLNSTLENEDGTAFFGSPTKLFEYAAAGRAIITSNAGSLDLIFSSAIFFDSADSPPQIRGDGDAVVVSHQAGSAKALAKAMAYLGSDISLRNSLGKTVRQVAEREFSWDRRVSLILSACGAKD